MEIVRTQVYLRKDQHRKLRDQAHALGISLTELLRRALDSYLGARAKKTPVVRDGLARITGLANSGPADGALRHDDYLADAIAEDIDRERNP